MNRLLPGLRFTASLLFALLFFALQARAQEMPTETRPGAYIAIGGSYSRYNAAYGHNTLGGIAGYIDGNISTNLGAEAEERWLFLHQAANVTERTDLIGPRITIVDWHAFVPYAKVLIGMGHFNFPYNYGTGNYFVVAPGAGLDLHFGKHICVRVIDFEYQSWPQFTYGAIRPYGVSAGMSYRIF